MKIGIIGAGRVGATLGTGWAAVGHNVMFSSRDPKSEAIQSLLAAAGAHASAGTVAETVAFGDVLVVAIGWPAVLDAVKSTDGWAGKVIIDTTNRFTAPPPDSVGSAAQDLARWTGGSVVKAFNTIGAEHMVNPDFPDTPTLFICGDDHAAKQTVTGLVEAFGFEVVDAGSLGNAELLEALAKLWVSFARGAIGRDVAFKLLKKR